MTREIPNNTPPATPQIFEGMPLQEVVRLRELAGMTSKGSAILSMAALGGIGVSLCYERPDMALVAGGVAFMSILTGVVASQLADCTESQDHADML